MERGTLQRIVQKRKHVSTFEILTKVQICLQRTFNKNSH